MKQNLLVACLGLLATLLWPSWGYAAPSEENKDFEGDDPGECSDGADNDRDGLFDCDDEGCAGAPSCGGGLYGSWRYLSQYVPGFGMGMSTGGGPALVGGVGIAPTVLPSLWLPSLLFRIDSPRYFAEFEFPLLDDIVLVALGLPVFHMNVRSLWRLGKSESPHQLLIGYGLNTSIAPPVVLQINNFVLGYEASVKNLRIGFAWETGAGVDYSRTIFIFQSLIKFRLSGIIIPHRRRDDL
jgi:hypothetical protein